MRETIFALATAPGRAAVAILRVSGPLAGDVLDRLCRRRPEPRFASLRTITDEQGEPIDKALVLWFPAPFSFTGEDVLELQLHGGPAVINAAASALQRLGARPAEPGEFTRRAFEAGRLELSQAEAIADLVDAETEAQRRQALSQLGGALSHRSERWRETLLNALAFLGAQMDFPDEDLPSDLVQRALAPITDLETELAKALLDVRGERVRDGFKIALVGKPNAGKSSLFNALLERDAAIVTPIAGTTRDVIEAVMIVEGYKVVLADTAGLRETTDEVEIEGIRRARHWADDADLRLWLVGPDEVEPRIDELVKVGDVVVFTKSDLGRPASSICLGVVNAALDRVSVSVRANDGLNGLRHLLRRRVIGVLSGGEFPAFTRARHRVLLAAAQDHLRDALGRTGGGLELIAEDVRLAARSLERLSGRIDPEEILDRVFGSFCIGK